MDAQPERLPGWLIMAESRRDALSGSPGRRRRAAPRPGPAHVHSPRVINDHDHGSASDSDVSYLRPGSTVTVRRVSARPWRPAAIGPGVRVPDTLSSIQHNRGRGSGLGRAGCNGSHWRCPRPTWRGAAGQRIIIRVIPSQPESPSPSRGQTTRTRRRAAAGAAGLQSAGESSTQRTP